MPNTLVRAVRWAAWGATAALTIISLFAVANVAITVVFLAATNESGRLIFDSQRLAVAGGRASGEEAERRYLKLYGHLIGAAPDPAAIRRHLEKEAAGGRPMVLDQALVEYIITQWGAVDGRTVPPGVYVGARAIGPDTPPLVMVTKYLAQYAFYPRHGYVVVIDAPGGAEDPIEFSASRASDFVAEPADPHQLMIRQEVFRPGAYDFPGQGQAVHELLRLSDDPHAVRSTGLELNRLAHALHSTGARYELFGQNSNTVLGCMLRASDLHRHRFEALRRDPLLKLRLIGIGSPLWSQPLRRPADARCR